MLEIKGLSVSYGKRQVIKNINLSVNSGEIVGLVGESGSGKSTILKSVMGLLESGGKVDSGEILFKKENLLRISRSKLCSLRGQKISMVFQHPELSLDPIWKIGKSYYEAVRVHRKVSRAAADAEAKLLLDALHLEEPERVLSLYPFELSGGMCQRVGIAIGIANRPELLLADEPTSALDVTVQKQVVDIMLKLREKFGTSIVIVSHNIRVIAAMADRIGVMKKGELVEWGTKDEVLRYPGHPYTEELIRAVPKINGKILGGGKGDGPWQN